MSSDSRLIYNFRVSSLDFHPRPHRRGCFANKPIPSLQNEQNQPEYLSVTFDRTLIYSPYSVKYSVTPGYAAPQLPHSALGCHAATAPIAPASSRWQDVRCFRSNVSRTAPLRNAAVPAVPTQRHNSAPLFDTHSHQQIAKASERPCHNFKPRSLRRHCITTEPLRAAALAQLRTHHHLPLITLHTPGYAATRCAPPPTSPRLRTQSTAPRQIGCQSNLQSRRLHLRLVLLG
jgi:hypothetical protein